MITISLNVDAEVWDCLKEVARIISVEEGEDVSASELIRRAIKETYICREIKNNDSNDVSVYRRNTDGTSISRGHI